MASVSGAGADRSAPNGRPRRNAAGPDVSSAGRRRRPASGVRRVAGMPIAGSSSPGPRVTGIMARRAIDNLMRILGYSIDHPGRAVFEGSFALLAERPELDVIELARSDLYNRTVLTRINRRVNGRPKTFIGGGVFMKHNSDEFRETSDLAEHLALMGFQIQTGGSDGAMEAAALGALRAWAADSARLAAAGIGIGLKLPTEQKPSPSLLVDDYFEMIGLPLRQAACLDAYLGILTPGGIGTLSELFDLYLYKIRIGQPGLVFLFSAGDPKFFDGIVKVNEWLDKSGFTRPGELYVPFMTSDAGTILTIVEANELFVKNLETVVEESDAFEGPPLMSRISRFTFDTSTTPPTEAEFAEFQRLFEERTAGLKPELKKYMRWKLHDKDHPLGVAHLELIVPPTQTHLVNLAGVCLVDAVLTSAIDHPLRFVNGRLVEHDVFYDPEELHAGGKADPGRSRAKHAWNAKPVDAIEMALGRSAGLSLSAAEDEVTRKWWEWSADDRMDTAISPFAVAHPLRNVESPPSPQMLDIGAQAIARATRGWTVREIFEGQRRFSRILNEQLPDGDFEKVTSPDYRGQNTLELLRILVDAKIDVTLFGTTALTAQGLLVPSGDADVIVPMHQMANARAALLAATGVKSVLDWRDPSVFLNRLVKDVHVSHLGVFELYGRESLEEVYGGVSFQAFADVTEIDFGDGLLVNSLTVPAALLATQACGLRATTLGLNSRQKDQVKQEYALALAKHRPRVDDGLIRNVLDAQGEQYGGLAHTVTHAGFGLLL